MSRTSGNPPLDRPSWTANGEVSVASRRGNSPHSGDALPAEAAPKEKVSRRSRREASDSRGRSDGRAIRVVAAHTHPLLLLGIASLFDADSGIALVGTASSGNEAMALIDDLAPDVAVLDLYLPERSGLDIAATMKDAQSPTRAVILASVIGHNEFMRARRLGVKGVVLTSMPAHLLVHCVRAVHAGGEFLERNVLVTALTKMTRLSSTADEVGAVLTVHELRIVQLVVKGYGNLAIASELGVTNGTVKSHLHHIYQKLRLPGRFALMQFAREKGIE